MCFSPQRRAIFWHRNGKKWSGADVFCTFSLENALLATATWLRTRGFNEPTFRLTRHTNHWKNTAFRDFSNIWRGCIFFLLTFALLHLLSSDSTSSSDFTFFYLLFICFSTLHIVGSLLFKLPSMIWYHLMNHMAYHGITWLQPNPFTNLFIQPLPSFMEHLRTSLHTCKPSCHHQALFGPWSLNMTCNQNHHKVRMSAFFLVNWFWNFPDNNNIPGALKCYLVKLSHRSLRVSICLRFGTLQVNSQVERPKKKRSDWMWGVFCWYSDGNFVLLKKKRIQSVKHWLGTFLCPWRIHLLALTKFRRGEFRVVLFKLKNTCLHGWTKARREWIWVNVIVVIA